ncbi:hypothetical protein CLIM01_15133, partial [Colletotrichum limetticola]
CKIPPDFSKRALEVIESYHKKRNGQNHGATFQRKRRWSSPDTIEQLRLTNASKRLRVGQPDSVESAGSDVVNHNQRLSVSYDSLLVTRKENRRFQRSGVRGNSRRDTLSPISSRRSSVSPSLGNNSNNDDDDDNDDNDDNGHNHDQENHDDSNHEVNEVHQNDDCSDSQGDGAMKDPSLLTSDTLLQDAGQLQMPHLHESQLDASQGSLRVPLQLQSQAQLAVSQDQFQMSQDQLRLSHENHFILSPATTRYTYPQADTLYLPNFRGYVVPKAYLYEELAHYPEMVKLLFPLTPGSSPFFTVDTSETQAKKYLAGGKRFM